jgi:hypothetical protein
MHLETGYISTTAVRSVVRPLGTVERQPDYTACMLSPMLLLVFAAFCGAGVEEDAVVYVREMLLLHLKCCCCILLPFATKPLSLQ